MHISINIKFNKKNLNFMQDKSFVFFYLQVFIVKILFWIYQ